jgi:HK97 family phage prohead protease
MYKYKEFPLVKSTEDAGKISGYFSTYDRIPDSYGDVIAKGAFTETIQKRKESGHPFPLCWNHDLNQIVGSIDPEDIIDDDHGPHMDASFFNGPLAQEKREIVKSGVVYQFSFAYEILDAGPVTLEDGTKANELRKLELFEVSIVPVPANPRAEVTDIKAGRRNSKKDADAIREAITLLQGVLGELEDIEEDPKDSGAKSEEQDPANDEEQKKLEALLKEANDLINS